MEYHIKMRCRAAYAQLFTISKIRPYLDDDTAEQLIHSLVHSHIDYCNSLLTGLPKCLIRKLQMVQNSAARVLCRLSKRERITPVLKRLHWLPLEYRIRLKVCIITMKALHNKGPAYPKDMLSVRNTGLRSSSTITLNVPRTHLTLGDRAFAATAPREWNELPAYIRSTDNETSFKKKLKHPYF